jgi:hypothetical protein
VVSSGWFFRARVGLLSLILASVCLWACHDVRARRARNEWQTPIRVGLVLVRHGAVDERALASLRQRVPALQQRLTSELRRYQPQHRVPMIQLVPYGPVSISEEIPFETDPGLWSRISHTYRLWRYTSGIDSAARVPTHALDSRIYVVARPARGDVHFVEGFSEAHGRVGVARVDLSLDTVDLALFVAAHELFHTLGATDKYDDEGRTLRPLGLPEPDRSPELPQHYAEVMARNRVVSPTLELPPSTLDELSVGRWTADEIGWTAGLGRSGLAAPVGN